MIRDWKEDYATGTKRTKTAQWTSPLGARNADFAADSIISKFRFNEEQSVGPYYVSSNVFISFKHNSSTRD